MNRQTYVYFIKPVGLAGPIKIGCSWLPQSRLESLSTWSPFPLEIVTTIPGRQRLEKNIHECFADLHLRREWFRADDRLLNAVERLKAGEPIDQVIDLTKRLGKITANSCGGAQWSEITRQKMSVFHRVRFAATKIGLTPYNAPAEIRKIMDASGKRILAHDELARIKAFADNPFAFVSPSPDLKEAV